MHDARVDEAEDPLARHHLVDVVRGQHGPQGDGPVGELFLLWCGGWIA